MTGEPILQVQDLRVVFRTPKGTVHAVGGVSFEVRKGQIFGIVGEELGLLGCLALIALFALLVYRGLRIAQEAPDLFGGLLASGITCWIGLQAMIKLGVVTGTIPFTGIALPFTSLGGSSLVSSMVGIGIVLSISRTIQADHSSHEARRTAQPGTKYRTLSIGR